MATNDDGATSAGEYHCVPKPTSRSTNDYFTDTFNFPLADYLQLKGMGTGEFVASPVFPVGGYDWEINFYPDGTDKHRYDGSDASCFLRYHGKAKGVNAKFALSMHQTTSQAEVVSFVEVSHVFSPSTDDQGHHRFVSREKLKSLSRQGHGPFTIRCALTVSKQSPPHTLHRDLERSLAAGDRRGADVTFRVGGRKFPAHRYILAVRSPVFGAQLFGPMAEKDMRRVKVVDVEPTIFEMMLHYIYTDSLPPCQDKQSGYNVATLQHLLVAADRYGIENLKLICENELCERIDFETVKATFALASQHNCKQLESACLEFMASSPQVLAAVLEADGFKEHFMASCSPMALALEEEGASGTKNRRRPKKEIHPGQKFKKIRTKQ